MHVCLQNQSVYIFCSHRGQPVLRVVADHSSRCRFANIMVILFWFSSTASCRKMSVSGACSGLQATITFLKNRLVLPISTTQGLLCSTPISSGRLNDTVPHSPQYYNNVKKTFSTIGLCPLVLRHTLIMWRYKNQWVRWSFKGNLPAPNWCRLQPFLHCHHFHLSHTNSSLFGEAYTYCMECVEREKQQTYLSKGKALYRNGAKKCLFLVSHINTRQRDD